MHFFIHTVRMPYISKICTGWGIECFDTNLEEYKFYYNWLHSERCLWQCSVHSFVSQFLKEIQIVVFKLSEPKNVLNLFLFIFTSFCLQKESSTGVLSKSKNKISIISEEQNTTEKCLSSHVWFFKSYVHKIWNVEYRCSHQRCSIGGLRPATY